MESRDHEITRLLAAARAGEPHAEQRLITAIYPLLRRQAEIQLRKERPGHTLQPTELINELYLKLTPSEWDWKDRNHFFSCASKVMRQLLVDHARQRGAQKRGGNLVHVELVESGSKGELELDEVLAVSQALDRLAQDYPRPAKVVEMRFFGGMTEEEIGQSLGLSSRTIKRDWLFARAWLFQEVREFAGMSGNVTT